MSERHITVDIVIAAVEAVTGIDRNDILADRREAPIARARLAAIWLASKLTRLSMPTLGRIFGDRNHTTILAGLSRAEEMREADPAFRLDTDTMLGVLVAIERNGLIRLAQTIDPLATARRVLANPVREAVRVSSHEIVALCQVALAAFGDPPPDDADPSDPASTAIEETDHAA